MLHWVAVAMLMTNRVELIYLALFHHYFQIFFVSYLFFYALLINYIFLCAG